MGTTYAIASAKGGVGKTTTVANLGVALAETGQDVVVVDADLGMANLAATLGVDSDRATVHDVLHGTAALEDALYDGPDGLVVLPGSTALSDYRDADLGGFADVLEELESAFDVVLVDTGAGLSHDAALPLELADEVVLVSTPQPQSLGDTDKTRELTERLGGTVAGLVVIRADPETTADSVDAELLGHVPDDDGVDVAVVAGDPIVRSAPASPAGIAYRRLAADLFDVDVELPEDAGAAAGEVGSDDSEELPGDESADDGGDGDLSGGSDEGASDRSDEDASDGSDDGDADPSDSDEVEETDEAVEETESDAPEESEVDDVDDTVERSETADPADSEERTETEASTDQSVETEDTEQESDEPEGPIVEDAEPSSDSDDAPASVGPHRTEDVPVTEAEPDAGAETITPPGEKNGENSSESKGLLRRLLGR